MSTLSRSPGSTQSIQGAFTGHDFHIGVDGPKLIEINTNAGGALINAYLLDAQRACCAAMDGFQALAKTEPDRLAADMAECCKTEWQSASGSRPLQTLVFVDPSSSSALWARRESLLFKPVAGFGGKANYRSDTPTKSTFEAMLHTNYGAQQIVPSSSRVALIDGQSAFMKLDVCAYAFAGRVPLVAADLWRVRWCYADLSMPRPGLPVPARVIRDRRRR